MELRSGAGVLTERRVRQRVEGARRRGDWEDVNGWIRNLFSSMDRLMRSFPNGSLQFYDARRVGADVAEVGRGLGVLFPGGNPSSLPYWTPFLDALHVLNTDISSIIKRKNGQNDKPFYIFLVLFELPILQMQDLKFNAILHSIFRNVCLLSSEAKGEVVRMWARKEGAWLLERVRAVHQLVTLHVLHSTYSAQRKIQDDDKVKDAVRVVEMLYYASLLGGVRDSEVELRDEREFYAHEDTEFQDFLKANRLGSVSGRRVLAVEWEGEGDVAAGGSSPAEVEESLESILRIRPIDIRQSLVSYEEFYNETLGQALETDRDFMNYDAKTKNKFSYLNYPFILVPEIKMEEMGHENATCRRRRRQVELMTVMLGGMGGMDPHFNPQPFLNLHVSRDHLVKGALEQLNSIMEESPGDLKKQLRVQFEGEQGVDEGGLSKEFYQLITEQLFNPDYGMFVYHEETRVFWFNPNCLENEQEFTLIGILFGLAVYNNIILHVRFPPVLYRKVFGKIGRFQDLQQLDPVLFRSLEWLLACAADEVETCCYTFRVSYKDVYGTQMEEDLKPQGDTIHVTAQNRKEFVDLYSNFLLNKSVKRQFSAFRRGFRMVTHESSLAKVFRAEEVEQLACGTSNFDFTTLERTTVYEDGFDDNHPTVKNFWEVVHDMNEDEKRLLLQFSTGSDRVPLGGLSALKFRIVKNGNDSDRFPTAHTCFNVLLLPEYATKAWLKDRLTKAITNSRGFGLQ